MCAAAHVHGSGVVIVSMMEVTIFIAVAAFAMSSAGQGRVDCSFDLVLSLGISLTKRLP